MKSPFRPDSIVKFLLSSPIIVFAIFNRLRESLSGLMAAVFQSFPYREDRIRRLLLACKLSFLKLNFAARFELTSEERLNRPKRSPRLSRRKNLYRF